MRRSLCYANPKFAIAGKKQNYSFVYQPGSDLPKGTKLKFDLVSLGRDTDWELPQCGARRKQNVIWLESEATGIIHAEQLEHDGKLLGAYEFTLTDTISQDTPLTIHMGSTNKESAAENGTRAQTVTQRRRSFFLSIDPKGKGEYKETEVFTLDVRGGSLEHIRILAPSLLAKNQRFDIVVRFEDAFGNLTGNADEGTLVELTYDRIRENINWKLFVPETGFITLPNLYFNEAGVYRIKLTNLNTKDIFFSAPILCKNATDEEMFWGSFRAESPLYDCSTNAEDALRHFRDNDALQFYGTSPFEAEEETKADMWKHISTQVADFNEDERYNTFLGMQWPGEAGEEGLHTIVYAKDNKSILRRKDTKTNSLLKIYRSHVPKDFFSIPSFTMAKGVHYNFDNFTPEFEKVVEIYNAWGSSECLEKEGNPFPISSKSKKGYNETIDGSIRTALSKNCRFGFVAGGFDDRGIFEGLFDTDQKQYTPGMTAIIAKGHTRDDIVQALSRRSCIATTGERMLVTIEIAQNPMGSELSTKEKPGLMYNRHIDITAVGTKPITQIELIRNGEVIHTVKQKDAEEQFSYDDEVMLDTVAFAAKEEKPPFVYYYVRITQEDGHVAWSSPIWIDLDKEAVKPVKRGRKKAS